MDAPNTTNQPEGNSAVNINLGSVSDISGGQINVAGGHIIHAEAGATVIIGGVTQAGNVFKALDELMDLSPEARIAMIEFENDIRGASQQVELLVDYKELHDLLHDLQYSCYNAVQKEARAFPDDEMGLESLQEYRFNLENLLIKLQSVLGRGRVAKTEATWVQEISVAQTEFQTALDQLDKAPLDKALWRLNRLLTSQPSRINIRLVDAARTLGLPSLVATLEKIGQNFVKLSIAADRIAPFQEGLKELGTLSEKLNALVEDHERWQTVDVELRRVGAMIDKDLYELEMSWPDLKTQAEGLYASIHEEWAQSLIKDSTTLEEALSGDNPIRTRSAFRNYSRRASNRFYQVDLTLKALCGELRCISDPLANILSKIGKTQ